MPLFVLESRYSYLSFISKNRYFYNEANDRSTSAVYKSSDFLEAQRPLLKTGRAVSLFNSVLLKTLRAIRFRGADQQLPPSRLLPG